jgi:hypothetical protein
MGWGSMRSRTDIVRAYTTYDCVPTPHFRSTKPLYLGTL